MKIKSLTKCAVFAALLCIIAPFSLFVGAVPVSLATFGVYLCGGALGGRKAVAAIAVYVLLGAVGLPVFSGFEGGFQKLAGLTGGYLIGYILCGFIVGEMTGKIKKFWSYPISMVLGTIACYGTGVAWFMCQTKVSLTAALSVCVLPFLIGDIIKITAASLLGFQLKRHII